MESFCYKTKQKGFPKLTNSTWYKTFKFSKSKNKSAKDLNPNNLSNYYETSNTANTLKNFNSSIPGTQKKINSSKVRLKLRSSSVPRQSISSQETDDSLFALSQIKNMDKMILKRINKNSIWREKMRNIYEVNTSRNCKEIKYIREKIYNSRFEESANFDLKSEINKKKYFPMERVPIINDAKLIIKKMENEFNKTKSVGDIFIKRGVDIQTFAKQNREICLKNNMINLLKEEKNKIKQKEIDYLKALDDANKGLLKDKQAFDQFIIENKRLIKKKELEVEDAVRKRKKVRDELYQLNVKIKIKQDEMEKIIRNIATCFSYAEFIHRIKGSQLMKNININKLLYKPSKNRQKNINYAVKTTFDLFGFLLNDENDDNKNTDINFNADQITYLFNSIETLIIEHIKERDNIIKEIKTQNDYSELVFLQKKKNQHQEELDFLQKELNYFINISLRMDRANLIEAERAQQYMNELFLELYEGDVRNNPYFNYYSEEKVDIAKIICNILHKKENTLIYYINSIENIEKNQKEGEDILKDVIEKVKTENKRIKYQNSRKLLKEMEEEKMIKYQERMGRVKIKSIFEVMPPWIKKKRKKKKIVKNDTEEENKQLLNYH